MDLRILEKKEDGYDWKIVLRLDGDLYALLCYWQMDEDGHSYRELQFSTDPNASFYYYEDSPELAENILWCMTDHVISKDPLKIDGKDIYSLDNYDEALLEKVLLAGAEA